MTNHAPGPWSVRRTDSNAYSVVGPTPVADAYRVIALPKNNNDGHWEANARLIAAAPELLEALQAQEEMTSYAAALSALAADGTRLTEAQASKGRELVQRAIELRRAAIAKATVDVND